MTTDQDSDNQSKHGSGQEPTNVERRAAIGAGLAALLVAACSSPTENRTRLSSSGLMTAEERDEGPDEGRSVPNDPFILLLKGLYQPVPKGSEQHNFGLTTVDVDDGSYSKTRIYPVFGTAAQAWRIPSPSQSIVASYSPTALQDPAARYARPHSRSQLAKQYASVC